jgi:hypothetical protein
MLNRKRLTRKLQSGSCMSKLFIVCILAAVAFFSCKTSSSVQKTIPNKVTSDSSGISAAAILDSISAHSFRFNYFSAKAKVVITEGDGTTEFTANIRMRNDSAIWISISPALGLEVARVLITQDSIRLIDRLNKKQFSKGFDFFTAFTSLPMNYGEVQNLICGNLIFIQQKNFSETQNDSLYQLQWKEGDEKNDFSVNKNFLNMMQHVVDPKAGSVSTKNLQYDIQYTPSFSLLRKIECFNPDQIDVEITFSKVKVNEPLVFPFKLEQ